MPWNLHPLMFIQSVTCSFTNCMLLFLDWCNSDHSNSRISCANLQSIQRICSAHRLYTANIYWWYQMGKSHQKDQSTRVSNVLVV